MLEVKKALVRGVPEVINRDIVDDKSSFVGFNITGSITVQCDRRKPRKTSLKLKTAILLHLALKFMYSGIRKTK